MESEYLYHVEVSGSSNVWGGHYSVVALILKRILAVVWLPDIVFGKAVDRPADGSEVFNDWKVFLGAAR